MSDIFRIQDRTIHVDLEYPRIETHPNAIEIDLMDVRASDGIRVEYDFSRDGWVIKQPKWTEIEVSPRTFVTHEDWIEVAFIQSWQLNPEAGQPETKPNDRQD